MITSINQKVDKELKIPQIPNFILTNEKKESIPISELSEAILIQIADAWKNNLIEKSRNK